MMPSPRGIITLTGVTAAAVTVYRRQIVPNAELSVERWREDPARQLGKVALSAAAGQGVFWSIGYDQLGMLMDTKVQLGFGRRVADAVYTRLPQSPATPWVVKAMEIAMDASKIPVEGALCHRHGVVPDGVAALVSQPLWSVLETAEKLAGALAHPERVTQPEAVKVSIGCIYGTSVRHVASILILLAGNSITTRRQQHSQ